MPGRAWELCTPPSHLIDSQSFRNTGDNLGLAIDV